MPPMANAPGGRTSIRSRLKLNPAFAAAHGIPASASANAPPALAEEDPAAKFLEKKKEAPVLPISTSPVRHSPTAQQKVPVGLDQAKKAIARARTSGKLQLADSGLETPLPTILFEFPSLAHMVDMSLGADSSYLNTHVAETLGAVDFSDNEGITEFPTMPLAQDSQHISENSVERYRSVQVFRARRCNLSKFTVTKTLPESWPMLLTLDLSGNKLSGEFPLLHLPKTIRELDLSGNNLTSLKSSRDPSTSIDLPQIVSIDISNNKLASTGISPVMHVPRLQRLNVGSNQIFNLSFILKAIRSSEKSLTTLNASRTMLSDLDGRQRIDVTPFVALLSADLSGNSLCVVPKIPFSLQRLNVNDNNIVSVEGLLKDEAIGSSLVVLQLQRNKVESLEPETISKLTQLNRLDLQFNCLSSVPLELGNLTKLEQMLLDGNNLNSLRSSGLRGDLNDTKKILMRLRNQMKAKKLEHDPEDVETVSSFGSCGSGKSKNTINSVSSEKTGQLLSSLMVGAKILMYEGKHAHMLPFQLLEDLKASSRDVVHRIEHLNVSKNQLQTIEADWFAMLPQLTHFEAQNNRISSLPANIRELGLSQVLLSKNSLSSHTVQFSLLMTSSKSNMLTDTLEVLDLSCNNLDTFSPELLRHFKSLRTLNLSRNKITSLKNIVDSPQPPMCPALEHLDLSENRIEDVGGDEFALLLKYGCPKLRSLKLNNNNVAKIPMTLGLLESLNTLVLHGNPQRMIRFDILDKPTSEVLQYFRNRMTAKTKEMVRLKMEELQERPFDAGDPDQTIPQPEQAEGSMSGSVSTTMENVETPGAASGRETAQDANETENSVSSPTPKKEVEPAAKTSAGVKAQDKPAAGGTPRSTLSAPTKASAAKSAPSKATPTKSVPSPRTNKIPTPKSRQGLSPVILSSNSPRAQPRTSFGRTKGKSGKAVAPSAGADDVTSPLLQELEKSIAELAEEMDRPGLSEPKRYAIKKKLQMERSKRIREERRLKQERAHSGIC